ncbi:AAA family ATPase [Saccharopolyspora shandongensis]|uniref:AAA family ATPase n=1 Tax=Saccharopolyspora shandongensis TaxID=418495 RepID=UPI000B8388AE|nr:AAA family ATPase [Saccharopolyspora shandongensis]
MGSSETPVLWVTGPPGAGKSTIGWRLFTRISGQGGSVAYVDIDQLGLIGPPPGGGAASHRIKAANLLRVIAVLRQRGVQQVIVSGVVDPELGVEPFFADSAEAAHLDLTLVRLHCDREELRSRFLGRGSPAGMLAELFEVVDRIDRAAIGIPLDTTGQRPDETVDALMGHCVVRPAPVQPPAPADGVLPPMPVVVVTGATAVGKSTAAWRVLRDLWQRGASTAYIDLDQLGFVHPGPDPVLQAANLAALWRGYRQAGAQSLLLVTREPGADLMGVLAAELVTVVRLDADDATLEGRIRRRADGESALLAGDELRGAPPEVQRRVAIRAAAEAERLRSSGEHRMVLDTTGQSSQETSAALLDMLRPALGSLLPERDPR